MSGFLGDDQFNYGPLPQVKVVEEEALEYGVDQILALKAKEEGAMDQLPLMLKGVDGEER
jgi:hypothetical protein